MWLDSEWFGSTWIESEFLWSQITEFFAQLFQLQNHFCAQHFRKYCCLQVFHFHFFCDIPQHDPSGDIKRPADGVEDITVARTVSLWDYGSNGYLCVHPSAGINVPPGSSASNIINTIQNTIGVLVLITVCLSDHLVWVDNGWLNSRAIPIISVSTEGVHNSYRENFRTFYFNRKLDLSQLLHHHIPRRVFPNWSGQ